MIAVAVVLAVLVGVSLGLLGGGGSILTVPLLAYVAGMEAKQAIATSLVVVGVTSTVSAISHARAGRVRWRSALLFGGAGIAGAYAGGAVGRFVPGSVLLIGLAVMMIATALAMIKGRNAATSEPAGRTSVAKTAALGLGVGLATGAVGAGGGFLVVPALVMLAGLPMPVAVGTSLVVIALNSFAGLAGHLNSVVIDWPVAAMVTAAAVLGSLLGARLTSRVNPDALRQGFGWFVLIMAAVILGEELHPIAGLVTATLIGLAALGRFSCRRFHWCPMRALFGPPTVAT
ncbi:sulfite exporter TauE/SafE family protein [Mycolicibacterium lutetiense]|jgi:uncharacterized protein|uniref:Probable membrane transporter protein n=1 Tax=Mycolicibacterium lutetiense TaxID=1641992 RepID=A0ABS4ZP91_9MYCO|nr:sulfite exporter TauE/SafE family protein [Mycolicibacterium lutetiense]MBP2451293.1 putative membrane protein YfcA [Mycolicibacterium lutetiense]